ncbi:MAG: glycosyltransferase family 4 protein, partial [Acidobacteria bacterium]|nr:glycosyltransferase family 4 protein [Acidobacteriota bacterium]
RRLHRKVGFDTILSFDLASTGGLAWRLGADLGIPACGWATGSDIRAKAESGIGRSVQEALRKLDLVFYQSSELKALGADLLGTRPQALPAERHVVQSRGVMEPETMPGEEVRDLVRSRLHLADDQVVILHLGRIVRGKGLFELVDGFAQTAKRRPDLVLLLVGAIPEHDDTRALEKKIRSLCDLDGRIRILPACPPHQIWEYFRASDIFAFPSFREGMPNSLLEAMLAGLPAVAFAIPAVQEITQFGKGLVEVPPHDFRNFGEALLSLAANSSRRREIGEQGRAIVREHFALPENMRTVVDHIQRLTTS